MNLKDKTMDVKLIYIPNMTKSFEKLLVEKFESRFNKSN